MVELSIIDKIISYIKDPNSYTIDELISVPLSITLNIPYARCNLNCKYCFLNSCKSDKVPSFNEQKIIPFLRPFRNETNHRVAIWGGEPLYEKDLFINICNCINKYLPSHTISIYTNGTLINDWWADFFKEHKVYITLSHDGPGQKFRGIDYFKQPEQSQAIKKIYNNGNLLGVSSVIHKKNCSFYDNIRYFDKVEQELDIKFDKRIRSIVGANQYNKIIYDFEYMDRDLINFITDSFTFLFRELVTGDKHEYVKRWFTKSSVKSFLPILQNLLHMECPPLIQCHTETKSHICLTTEGDSQCIYAVYNNIVLPKECKNTNSAIEIPSDCKTCEIYNGCPVKGCLKLSTDKEFCKTVKNRYKTIEFALKELLKNQFNYKG